MSAVETDDVDAPQAILFNYRRPTEPEGTRQYEVLARTDIAFMMAQVMKEGGENKLHSHRHTDGFWLVMSGRARFYTENDELVAELGPGDGIVTPRHYRYWFEKTGPDDLELLQFEASDKPKRTSVEAFVADRDLHE